MHVEVFRAECVGALILGRPRPLSGHRRAGPPRDVRYTLIWEEPPNLPESESTAVRNYLMRIFYNEDARMHMHTHTHTPWTP